jgi:polysaccharide biosynthesis protein PslH
VILKILLLTQVLPYPPDSGPKVKTLNVIKYLSRLHELTLISYVRGDQSAEIEALRQYCREIYPVPIERKPISDGLALARSLVTGLPWMMARDDRRAMRATVQRVLAGQRFDIVQADQLNMAQFAQQAVGPRKVVDTHNALWVLYQRMAATMKGPKRWLLERDWRLLKKYEGRICREFDAVTAVSVEDRNALVEAGADPDKIWVIPISVDCDDLRPIEPVSGANHILHIGTMYWPPNIDGILWFIREVYPLIRRWRTDVVFDVVGARPPEEIVRLGGDGSGINVTGYVKNPIDIMRQAGVMVVPLRAGGGMRVKILNSMAQALPIVSTSIGCEGIAVQDGCHLIVADTAEAFAAAALRLFEDRALAHQLGQNGRQLILSRYDYRAACREYEHVYGN